MVPLSALLRCQGPAPARTGHALQRLPAADINGGPAPGFSSGQAQAAAERIAPRPCPGHAFEWTDLTYQEILAGNAGILGLPDLCVLLVFLVLAAQYESLTLPLAVILIVPMSMLAASPACG
jgi:multidrug efflux pump